MSGAQAGFVPMLFLSKWDQDESPMRLQRYNDMLFPQYADRFTKISTKMFAWLQEQAAEKLRESPNAAASVIEHWESIVAGRPPFGLQVTA